MNMKTTHAKRIRGNNLMGLLDSIERLLVEHGSAVVIKEGASVLKERINLANEKYAILEQKVVGLEIQIVGLNAENAILRRNLDEAENKIQALKAKNDAIHNANPNGDVCEHCGSPRLKRSGSRPNDTFSALGVKDAVFTCQDCGKESAFIIR